MTVGRDGRAVEGAIRPRGEPVDRSRPPEPGDLRPLSLPRRRRFRLDSGLEVWVVEDSRMPEVSVRMVLDAGALREEEGEMGVAELTGRLLTEGTGERSALEMAGWLDRLGADFSASVGYDATLLGLHTLSEALEGSLDFLRAAVREPAFRPEEVERVRGELVDELERDRDEADVVADHALIRAVFGAHRFGTPSAGTPESVSGLTREDVDRFYGTHYDASDVALVVCGDVDAGRIRDALEARFGDWPGGPDRPPLTAPADGALEAGRVILVDRPGSAQAEIRVGGVGLPYGGDDFFEAMVANSILGGLFNSRVNMNLREEKGWTYGARTAFYGRRVSGPFVGQAAVETEAAAPALSEFVAEIRGLWERPPTREEIGLAKNSLVLSLPRKFETVHQVSRRLTTQLVYGLAPDYWERYRERVEAVAGSAMVEAARRLLEPDSLTAVVVAEADAVAPELEREFGEVEVRPAP